MKIDASYYPHWNQERDTHLYIKPQKELQDYIAHYTYMQDGCFDKNATLVLVPDAAGCLVFQDSGHGFECILWGPTTKRVKVHANHNITFRFFVEFQPTGAYALFHHDINRYINQLVSLFEVDRQMEEAIQEAYSSSFYLHEFIEHMNKLFYSLVERNNQEDTKLGTLLKTKQDIGYSTRQLQRLYQKHFGCSKKEYQRVERINQAIQCMQEDVFSLSEIAQKCGYYDESHFIHDFQRVMDVTPNQYKEQMADFYNELHKF